MLHSHNIDHPANGFLIYFLSGATPLMNACQNDSVKVVDFLLANNADLNARDNRGFTALHRAAEMGKYDISTYLQNSLSHGLRVDPMSPNLNIIFRFVPG
ncbi:ankyrin repeat domain-containing protein [bacterium]|nr:ankyrin repeat domain-containing protein [bacterium]